MRRLFHHPLRSTGAALTVAGAAVVFVVLILPSIAAGGSPGGKYKVTGYQNQKGQSTHKLYVGSWFYLTGTQFGSSPITTTVFDVYCWEGNDPSKNQWTEVSVFTFMSSKLMQVDLSDDCAGRPGNGQGPILVQWDPLGDSVGMTGPETADDIFVYGPPGASINENASSLDT